MLICLQLCWIVFWLEQWNLLNFKLSWVCFEVLWQDRPYNWDQSLKKKPIFEDKLGIIDGTYQNFPKLITRIIMIILPLFYLINLYFNEKCQNWYWYIFSRMFILLNFDPNLRQQGKCDAFFRREKRPLREFG